MDWIPISYGATAIGAIVGVVNIAAVLRQQRARRFYERSIRLLDLRERLVELGPMNGPFASSSAPVAHDQLVREYEREARTNAALFVSADAWLKKPGSYVWGFGALLYSLLTASITGVTVAQNMEQHPLAVAITALLPGTVSVVLAWTGARQLLRRDRVRTVRRQIGEVDPVSREGILRSQEVNAVRRLLSWLARRVNRSSGKGQSQPENSEGGRAPGER
ncbi:hypothetical protein [Homoserinimonas sp. A520]